ncbi:MAG TPA: bifunctional phosphopantothenoylcysteine decarboxylase/phosphopantothenate--cysteine ligase CoaBC, partial [bacterium]|nr:bifunctional phosphopantothenoylcysteine decarboxylase/phosphopantothenate--cysteine ligase CoaBC [bacterium]
TGNPVAVEQFRRGDEEERLPHITLRQWAEVLVICPATADLLAKCARGIADDLLTTTYLSCSRIPVIFAPAMNPEMWAHPAVQENIAIVRDGHGQRIVGPASGGSACGETGEGRLAPLAAVEDVLRAVLYRTEPDFGGRRVVITAGPTQEPLDGVRVLTNRSSGKMGYALARAAAARGAEVVLVSGPVALPAPHGVRLVRVQTAAEMLAATLAAVRGGDLVIGAAAVADYRPAAAAAGKPAKTAGGQAVVLQATDDIIAAVAATGRPAATVGFCAVTDHVAEQSREKLQRKRLTAIAGNDVSRGDRGIEADDNQLVWITPAAEETSPVMPKVALAHWLLDHCLPLLTGTPPADRRRAKK